MSISIFSSTWVIHRTRKYEKVLKIRYLPSGPVGVASGDKLSWHQSAPVRIWTTRSRLSDTRSASLSVVFSRWTTPHPDWLVITVTFEYRPDHQIMQNANYKHFLLKKKNISFLSFKFSSTSENLFEPASRLEGWYANNWVGDQRYTSRQTNHSIDATEHSFYQKLSP